MSLNEDYLNLITSEHKDKPNYLAVVTAGVSPLVELQNVLLSLLPKFDLDIAIGDQEDILGQWAGISRSVPIPITGVYFEWDSADVGWELGSWKDEFDPSTGPILLPNDVYRTVIKAKIAANKWNGSIPDAYEIYKMVFGGDYVVIQDNQNMTMTVGIFGQPLNAILKALLVNGYIALKPEGVAIAYYAIVVNSAPLMSWDIDTEALNGWDIADWPQEFL